MIDEPRNNLILAMYDPSKVLYSDEFLVIIADQFPKSHHHYLVISKKDLLDVRSLRAQHIHMLIYMEFTGLEYVKGRTGLMVQDLK